MTILSYRKGYTFWLVASIMLCLHSACELPPVSNCEIQYELIEPLHTPIIGSVRKSISDSIAIGLSCNGDRFIPDSLLKLKLIFDTDGGPGLVNDRKAVEVGFDSQGIAKVDWILGDSVGEQTLKIFLVNTEPLINLNIPIADNPLILSAIAIACSTPFIDNRDNAGTVGGPGALQERYPLTLIGDQCWMTRNLSLGNILSYCIIQTDQEDSMQIERFCYDYKCGCSSCCDSLGGLYQWNQLRNYDLTTKDRVQGICPAGWHIPSDEEWKRLEQSLGLSEIQADESGWRGNTAGDQLKSFSYGSQFGSSGFEAKLGGRSVPDQRNFEGKGESAYFWTATSDTEDPTQAWARQVDLDDGGIKRFLADKRSGFSCRCVKD